MNVREFFIISLSTDYKYLNSSTEAPRISSLSPPFLLFRLVSRERGFRERNGDDVDDDDDADGRNFVERFLLAELWASTCACVRGPRSVCSDGNFDGAVSQILAVHVCSPGTAESVRAT